MAMKRKYETPVVDLLKFDYRETVVASGKGDDASHCTFNRQPGGCAPKSYGSCGNYYTSNPGKCKNG
jgi:hypothetical protein